MIIGIDGNEANQKIRVGSGVYAFELLKQFTEFRIQNLEFRIYLKDKPIEELPLEDDYWKYEIVKPSKFWTQVGLPIKLWKEKLTGNAPDVFFSPSHYAPRFCPIPSVITIFDLSFIRFPGMFLKKDLWQLKNWTEYSVRQAKKIITISEFSKKEIVDYYKVDPEKVVVVYPGFDQYKDKISNIKNKKYIEKIKNKFKVDGDYLLFVGTIQPRKNLVRLVEAFHQLKIKNEKLKTTIKNLKLVIAGMIKEGRGGWMQEEIIKKVQSSKFKVQSDIILTGYVSDYDIPYLMAGAKALILPSLYEGFGIPVIEAMACGIPTVVSNVSSLPEIVEDAAILVDPHDVDSIASAISEACYNDSKREELIKKGLQQVKRFDWEKSARKIIAVLTE